MTVNESSIITLDRRATDGLRDKLEEQFRGMEAVGKVRWEGHAQEHEAGERGHERVHAEHDKAHALLAISFATYKVESNEWRASMVDLKGSFVAEVK